MWWEIVELKFVISTAQIVTTTDRLVHQSRIFSTYLLSSVIISCVIYSFTVGNEAKSSISKADKGADVILYND